MRLGIFRMCMEGIRTFFYLRVDDDDDVKGRGVVAE